MIKKKSKKDGGVFLGLVELSDDSQFLLKIRMRTHFQPIMKNEKECKRYITKFIQTSKYELSIESIYKYCMTKKLKKLMKYTKLVLIVKERKKFILYAQCSSWHLP